MSVYEGLYTEYLLAYSAPGTVTEDDAGRPVESAQPETVRAWFEPTRSPEVVRMVGADGSAVVVEGGLLGVEAFPDGLVTGSEVGVHMGGRQYRLELILRPPSAFALVDELEGPRFYGRLHGPL